MIKGANLLNLLNLKMEVILQNEKGLGQGELEVCITASADANAAFREREDE